MRMQGKMDEYTRQMLLRKMVPRLLPLQIREVDGKTEVRYETGGFRSLAEDRQSSRFGEEELRGLFDAVAEVLRQLSEALLPAEGLLLSPEHIYRGEEGDFFFSYLPQGEGTFREGLRRLGAFLLPRLNRAEEGAVLRGYAFYQKVEESGGSVEVFRQFASNHPRAGMAQDASATRLPAATTCLPAATTHLPEAEKGQETRAFDTRTGSALPSKKERAELLDSFFRVEEEHEPFRLELWQQRIILGAFGVSAAAFVAGAAIGELFIGAGCTLIATAVAALLWLRRMKSGV